MVSWVVIVPSKSRMKALAREDITVANCR